MFDVVVGAHLAHKGRAEGVAVAVLGGAVAVARDQHEVFVFGDDERIALGQDVVEFTLGREERLTQLDHHVGGIDAVELGVAEVGEVGRSARAHQQRAEALVVAAQGVVARVLDLTAHVDQLLKAVVGLLAQHDLVVGLEGEAQGLRRLVGVLGKGLGHLEGEELGAALAGGVGVHAADFDAAQVGVKLGSAGHAQHVAQGQALGERHRNGLAHRAAHHHREALAQVGVLEHVEVVAVAQRGVGGVDKHLGAAAVAALAKYVALGLQSFVAKAAGALNELGRREALAEGVPAGVAHGAVDFDVVVNQAVDQAHRKVVAREDLGTRGMAHQHVDQGLLAVDRTHELHTNRIGVFGEPAGVVDQVLDAFARRNLIGHGAAHRALDLRSGSGGLDDQVVAVLGKNQGRLAGVAQVAVEVEGLDRLAPAHHAHAAHRAGLGGSARGGHEVEGAVGGGQRVGSGLLNLAGHVDRDAAGEAEGRVDLVAREVEVGGQALGDGFVGFGEGHARDVEAPEVGEFDESAGVHLEGLAHQGGSVDGHREFVAGADEVVGRSLHHLVALGVGLEVGLFKEVHAKDVAAVGDFFWLRKAVGRVGFFFAALFGGFFGIPLVALGPLELGHAGLELGGFFGRKAHRRGHGFGVGLAEALGLAAGDHLLNLGVAELVDADVTQVLGREGGGGNKGYGGQKAVETHGLEHLAAKIRV